MITAEVWFDIACPWCYIGMRKWAQAVAGSGQRVRTRWRSFQLRPDAARTPARSLPEIMSTDWGLSATEIDQIFTRIRHAGAEHGLVLRTESVHPVNTMDAHRLVHHAAKHDVVPALLERLYFAYHTELRNIADHDVLTELATDTGLVKDEIVTLLAGDQHADTVLTDHAEADKAGVTAVPGYRIGDRTLSGALPVDELRALLSGRSVNSDSVVP
ncbi:DsbA family oxidoreductase [Amycolatopsis nigrescens]|uniref:DsbA family oxidoreductase n=1 Tax=Amycolatopsis nigrescens TaxID=381445 RepID=UPI0003708A2B|nr:DsbA family oxidoreductase [Amycolatopsis nigrescens]